MELSEVTALFKDDLNQVEKYMKDNFSSEIALIPEIGNYILSAGGKRVRPLLLLLSSRLCGRDLNESVIKHCCVVEYVHAATLLHDDVVDETTVRRGRKTVNSKWGSDASILVGDFLIARAIGLLGDDVDPKIFKSFAQAAKTLVEGGLLEYCHARDILVTEKHCLDVIYGKTASLMQLSCQLGAQIAEANPEQEKALAEFGKNFGIAFQIVDDLMDYDGDPSALGKPVGTDLKEGHVTLPLLYLYQKADRPLKREIERFIGSENVTNKDFEYIQERMREFRTLELVHQKAQSYMDRAQQALNHASFPVPQHTQGLLAVANFIYSSYTPSNPSLTPTH